MENFNSSMQNAKLLISNAIDSEESSKNKLEIYKNYIKSMNQLFFHLNQDLESYDIGNNTEIIKIVAQKHLGMLKSARSCISRSILQLEETPSIQEQGRSQSMFQRPCSITPEYKSMPTKKSIDILISEKPLNPIDSAKNNLQNMINNTKKLLQSPRLSSSQRISVQLQLSRMIEETMSIARKKETEICKVMTNDLEQLQHNIDYDINYYSIFKNENDLSQLYRSSLLFYQHILKGSKWYELAKLNRCPEESCLSFILRMNDNHPIVLFIDKIIQTLVSQKVNEENVEIVSEEIKGFTSKIEKLSKVCCLIGNANNNIRNFNASQSLLNLLCEYIYTKPVLVTFLYNFLFTSSSANMEQYNANVKLVQERYSDSVLLPEKFTRNPSIKEVIDGQTEQLKNLRSLYNPLKRMSKLCELIQNTMSMINEKNTKLEIGADELVPILSYMIIKYASAEILLHVKYLELFIPNDNMMGMEGYILVSVCCAITFCFSDKFESYLSSNSE